ncbi:MAG: HEAT repeat domain-containing protein [Chloroflexota bacterium]
MLGIRGNKDSYNVLTSLLNDSDGLIREWSTWGLRYYSEFSPKELFFNKLSDSRSAVRRYCIEGLVALGNVSCIDTIISQLGDEGATIRKAAVRGLGRHDSHLATQPLLATLNDNDSNVRASAATALGNLKATEAVDALRLALYDPDGSVGNAAADALGKIGDRGVVPALLTNLHTGRVKALARLGVYEVIPFCQSVIRHTAEDASAQCTFGLIHLAPSTALNVLQTCERRFPMKAWIMHHQAQAHWQLGDLDKAQASFECILALKLERNQDILALAHYHLETGNLDEALHLAKRADFENPFKALPLLTLALVHYALDDLDQAKTYLQRARIEDRRITDIDDLKFEHFWREKAVEYLEGLLAHEAHSGLNPQG